MAAQALLILLNANNMLRMQSISTKSTNKKIAVERLNSGVIITRTIMDGALLPLQQMHEEKPLIVINSCPVVEQRRRTPLPGIHIAHVIVMFVIARAFVAISALLAKINILLQVRGCAIKAGSGNGFIVARHCTTRKADSERKGHRKR